MTQPFQLQPPPDALRTPLVQLKDYYNEQVNEYLQKLALAQEKLAHVEALLEGWSTVEQQAREQEAEQQGDVPVPVVTLPEQPPLEQARDVSVPLIEELPLNTELPHQNPPPPTSAVFSPAISQNGSSYESDVAEDDGSRTSGNANLSGAQMESTVQSNELNGTSSDTANASELLERFKDTLSTSTRTLLSFCDDSGGIELIDCNLGKNILSLQCPNNVIFRRIKLKLLSLVCQWYRLVGKDAIVVVSTAQYPLDSHVLSEWSKDDLVTKTWAVDKVIKVNGVSYSQLRHNEYPWLVVVPKDVLLPLLSQEKPSVEPLQSPTTTNTVLNGNSGTSSEGVQEVEMLPPYQGMNRMEALSLLFAEHSGTVLHLDFIVRSLYGIVEPTLLKVIKKRVGNNLTSGVEQKLWARVADSPGCYTLDLKLVEPAFPERAGGAEGAEGANEDEFASGTFAVPVLDQEKASPASPALLTPPASPAPKAPPALKASPVYRSSKSSYPHLPSLMLPPYRSLSLRAAVTSLLEANPGKVYCIDDFIAVLFGEVEPRQRGRVRAGISRALSKEKLDGRFDSVPGSVGCYTLNRRLLKVPSRS
ncbi:MAG TPA: hypothetical protein V6C95_21495 [Coleofasciculaceae cyanobacterium]